MSWGSFFGDIPAVWHLQGCINFATTSSIVKLEEDIVTHKPFKILRCKTNLYKVTVINSIDFDWYMYNVSIASPTVHIHINQCIMIVIALRLTKDFSYIFT